MSTPAKIKSQRSDAVNAPFETRAAYIFFHTKKTKSAAGELYQDNEGNATPRHASTLLIPKLGDASVCKNYAFLWGLAVQAAMKMWPTSVDASGQWQWPAGAKFPVNDGDVPFPQKPQPGKALLTDAERIEKNKWRNGFWTLDVESRSEVGVAKVIDGSIYELPAQRCRLVQVQGHGQMLADAAAPELYKSGDWGIPNIHAYAYQNKTFGVNFGFDGFLFTREGEAIGNGGGGGPRSASQMFGGLGFSVAASAPAAAAPVAPQAPAAPAAPALPAAAPAAGLPGLPPAPGAGLPGLPPPPPAR